jgi:signal transduction histidine kinase
MSYEKEYNLSYIFFDKDTSPLPAKCDFMDQIFSSNALGIAVYSVPDFKLLRANKKFLSFLDKPYDKISRIKGLKPADFIKDWEKSEERKFFNKTVSTGKVVKSKEYQVKLQKGKCYWETIFVPVIDEGIVKYIISNTEDKTEKVLEMKNMEKQKEDLEKILKTEQEFFSFISHEFKTPLTVALSAIQAVESICKDEVSDRAFNYISKIRQSSFQQLRLVNNLLDIAKSDSGYFKVNSINADIVSMTRVISESVYPFAKEKGVIIEFSSEMKSKIIGIDDEKYERILLNLLSNAVKFTPCGKKIFVTVSNSEGKIQIGVKDEGIGIPKEKQNVIFERYVQAENSLIRNTSGTGIGLCLVKHLVKILGGDIKLFSEEGKGSTFTIILPDKLALSAEKKVLKEEFMDDRLTKALNMEFSNIYFE